jgi:hypothetical protein
VYNVHVASGWRHPHKEINKALRSADDAGFEVIEVKHGHVWGRVVAPNGQQLTVWSTPRSPETMAKRIREFVRRHGDRQG